MKRTKDIDKIQNLGFPRLVKAVLGKGSLFFLKSSPEIKVIQINYASRNQLHSTANLNFGLMGKKAKHCWVLSTNISVQLIVFLDHVLLFAELAQKFKFLQNSCMAK